MTRHSLKALTLACAAALLGSSATLPAPAAAQADLKTGPTSLLISYRTKALNRAAFRKYLVQAMAPRLRALKAAGTLTGFHILYSWYHQPQVWDAMVVLHFSSFQAVTKWNTLEHDLPGGLDAAGLALADPVTSYSSDLEWSNDPEGQRPGEVYYVIPYEYRNEAEYRDYVKGYVVPQFEGWRKDGALDGYELFVNRFGTGAPWDSLFIQRYHDMAAFGRRQEVSDATRAVLRNNPEWKAWSDKKAGIRTESENSIAELIAS